MFPTLLLPLLLAGPVASGGPAQDPEPPVRLWLNSDRTYEPGDRAKVEVRTAEDGYLVVLQADPEGRLRVLFPLDPLDDNFVRGGRKYELRGRGGRESFAADRETGRGYVYAAFSRDPFRFGEFTRGDHWDYRALAPQQLSVDPEAELTELVQRMAVSGFDYDILSYDIYEPRYRETVVYRSYDPFYDRCFGCYAHYDPWDPYFSVSIHVGSRWPRRYWYDPYWDPWWDPYWHSYYYDPYWYPHIYRPYYPRTRTVFISRPPYRYPYTGRDNYRDRRLDSRFAGSGGVDGPVGRIREGELGPSRRTTDTRPSVNPPSRRRSDPSVNPPARRPGDSKPSVNPPARRPTDSKPSVNPPARRPSDSRPSVNPPARRPSDSRPSVNPPASRPEARPRRDDQGTPSGERRESRLERPRVLPEARRVDRPRDERPTIQPRVERERWSGPDQPSGEPSREPERRAVPERRPKSRPAPRAEPRREPSRAEPRREPRAEPRRAEPRREAPRVERSRPAGRSGSASPRRRSP